MLATTTNWIDIESIEIDKKQVCRNLGYSAGSKLTTRTRSLINEYVEHAQQLIEPSYLYVVKDIETVRRSCVYVEDSIVFKSALVSKLLKQCCKVAIFVATIGSRLEQMSIHLAKEGLILQSAVLDATGSVATNEVAEFIQSKIREIAGDQGLIISQRFSPGYCDWSIRQQKEIFRAVDGNMAGITLTEEYLMIPQKSISGIIGIGHPDSGVDKYNPCKTCNKRDCIGRR